MSSTATPAKRAPAKKATVASTVATTPVAVVAAPAPVVAAPTPVAAPVATTATETIAAAEENVNVVAQFNQLVEQVNTLRSTLGAVFSSMKKLEKQIPRELKKASKRSRRGAAAKALAEGEVAAPKKETVFTKPTPISDALCTFLSVPKGTLLSRSEVTTRVCKYAKDNQLMVKQVIKTDTAAGAPLRKLLALTEADELKILNLQRYLKPHYIKPAATA